ncbi:MAG: alpha/beta fold hydrolase [Bacteroidota bacterium]
MSQKSHTFEDALDLELGGSLSTPHVNYTTYGELNASRDNVIWACHALTANSEVGDWWNALFGEGELFDPTKYFIICANNLGSPYGTSSPKTINPTTGEGYRHEFPAYTIRDTASLHLRLLDHLNIASIHCLIGGSCGGNIAQEMAISLGDRVKSMRIMCCSAQESPWVISIHESQRIAMHADLTFKGNEPTAGQEGLRGARAFALPFYRSNLGHDRHCAYPEH